MKKLIRFLFPKYKVALFSFQTGTDGMERHRKFLKDISEENAQIINSFIEYHRYDPHQHKPAYINYVIRYKI